MISDHHRFVETRKGVPINRADTPDAVYLEPPAPFAKGFPVKMPGIRVS
jgi:hypothetical protein